MQHWLSLCHHADSVGCRDPRITAPELNRAEQEGWSLSMPSSWPPALPWWRAGLTRQSRDPGAQTGNQPASPHRCFQGHDRKQQDGMERMCSLAALAAMLETWRARLRNSSRVKGTGDGSSVLEQDHDTRKWVHTYQAVADRRRGCGRVTVRADSTTKNTQVRNKASEVFEEGNVVQLVVRRRQLE